MPAILNRYATPLITGLFLVSMISGIALFFHWGSAWFHGMHEWLSMVLIVPFVLLDLFVLVYQAACFPVYGIPKVPRRDFIRMDRHHLAYLNGVQKLNCIYCGYCNGVIAWVREVASRTEAYWCPIKHAARVAGAHARYAEFSEFGDGEGFEAGLARSRRKVQEKDGPDEADGA